MEAPSYELLKTCRGDDCGNDHVHDYYDDDVGDDDDDDDDDDNNNNNNS